ncbi:MAG: arsenate reductase (glutaredoxin) [Gammaproteobacteria bacterium]
MSVTLYHNPRCSKSRQTLALLEEHGITPEIVLYLDNPPSVDELGSVLTMLGVEPREAMRRKEDPYKANGLDDDGLSRNDLIAAMVANPILIERPIVVTNGKAAIGRPPESVLDIL